jgi:hypothetical protein
MQCLVDARPLLDAEVVAHQVEVDIARVANRGDVAGAVPGCAYAKGLADDRQLAGRRDAADLADVYADNVDQAVGYEVIRFLAPPTFSVDHPLTRWGRRCVRRSLPLLVCGLFSGLQVPDICMACAPSKDCQFGDGFTLC